jgi:spore germination protein KC
VMDWAVRRRDIQLILNFAVGRPEALQVLHVKPQSEHIPSNSLIMAMSGEGTESPFIASVFSYQLMRNVYEKGIDPILPIIEAQGTNEFLINKIALLDKQKIRLVLTPNETRLYNLLTRRNLRTNLPAHYKDGVYQYYTESSSSSYRIHTPGNGDPYIQYRVKIIGILEENSTQDMVTPTLLKGISKDGGSELKKDIEKLLVKIKSTGLDPLGWGLRYGSRHFNNDTEMEEWQRLYPKLRFEAKVDVNIKYSGMIK